MKYNFCVGAIFKDEADCLEEWINHYLSIDTNHIYLINDKSSDNYMDIIKKYNKYITLYDNVDVPYFYGRQDYIYNRYFKRCLDSTDWISILDIDEYLWSPYEKNINLLLKKIPIYINGINIWSVCFGSNGHKKQPNSVVKSFIKREALPKKQNSIYKNMYHSQMLELNLHKQIVRSRSLINFHVHQHNFDFKYTNNNLVLDFFNIKNNIFRINHYKTQSEEKWKKKANLEDVNNYKPQKIYTLNSIIELHQKDLDWVYYNTPNNNYRNINYLFNKLNGIYNIESDFELLNSKLG